MMTQARFDELYRAAKRRGAHKLAEALMNSYIRQQEEVRYAERVRRRRPPEPPRDPEQARFMGTLRRCEDGHYRPF